MLVLPRTPSSIWLMVGCGVGFGQTIGDTMKNLQQKLRGILVTGMLLSFGLLAIAPTANADPANNPYCTIGPVQTAECTVIRPVVNVLQEDPRHPDAICRNVMLDQRALPWALFCSDSPTGTFIDYHLPLLDVAFDTRDDVVDFFWKACRIWIG